MAGFFHKGVTDASLNNPVVLSRIDLDFLLSSLGASATSVSDLTEAFLRFACAGIRFNLPQIGVNLNFRTKLIFYDGHE
jgi:hypothetical protein